MANAVFSTLLLGSSGYALYQISYSEYPCAFAACAVGVCHALAGIYQHFSKCDGEGCMNRSKRFTSSCIEVMPLPMINIELYLKSEQSSPLAMGHGLFVIPLSCDLINKMQQQEDGGEESSTEILKNLTILGNIVSLIFLASNESNTTYGIMAFAAFCAKYGAELMDFFVEGSAKIPVIVGGTNYYIESLLWNILVAGRDNLNITDNTIQDKQDTMETKMDLQCLPAEVLYDQLKDIDPETANRLHRNNKRKIIRAIEYYQDNGETLSTTLRLQRQQPGGSRLGGALRYPHTIILWLTCEQEILNDRLNRRVDSMLAQGLLEELRKFHKEFCPDLGSQEDEATAFTKGILQTIGYKEFIAYVQKFDERNDKEIEAYLKSHQYKFPDPEKNEDSLQTIPTGLDVLKECLDQLKLVTQRYSRRQIKWIKNRFLTEDRQAPDVFQLDTSDVQLWDEKVYKPAVAIIEAYQNNETSEYQPTPKHLHVSATLNTEISNYCSICQRQFIGEFQWKLHMKSNKHKRKRESLKRNESKHLKQANQQESYPKDYNSE